MRNIDNEYLKRFNLLSGYDPGKGLISETTQLNLVKKIVDFLDANYKRGETTEITTDGHIGKKKVIGIKGVDDNNLPVVATQISPEDLFYRLEDQFKGDIEKSDKRDNFLKQCIIDWYNEYDGLKTGNLSKNISV